MPSVRAAEQQEGAASPPPDLATEAQVQPDQGNPLLTSQDRTINPDEDIANPAEEDAAEDAASGQLPAFGPDAED